ncbi:integrase, partial [Cupriavidus sp. LEh21]|nr:integrase [Cupriavidus sp. LEh21]
MLFDTARAFPSPRAPLRPLALYTMLVLARLDLRDIDLSTGLLDVRDTKFFKSRSLPLSDSVLATLREYLDARRRAG